MTFDDARKPKAETGELSREVPLRHAGLPSGKRAEEDREQYSCLYNRIYPLLKEGRLDFHHVAERTGYKERRIRETLLFRLTTGEVMQLFGRKEGFCYICSRRMLSTINKEPLCLGCLSAIDAAVQDQPHFPDETAFERLAYAGSFAWGTERKLHSFDRAAEPPGMLEQYEAVLAELERYRARFGPLEHDASGEDPGMGFPEVSGTTEAGEEPSLMETPAGSEIPNEPASPDRQPVNAPLAGSEFGGQDHAFLDVLSLKDEDLPVDSEIDALLGDLPQENLRHFGFQRLRAGN